VVSSGGCDVCETELAARFGFDFGGRKNELPGDWFGFGLEVMVAVFHFHLQEIALGYGGVEFGLALSFALSLEGFEVAQGFFERALEALFVEGQVDEGFVVVAEDSRGGENGVDLDVFSFNFAGFFGMAEGEHGVFERAGSVQAPLGVAVGLGVLFFERGLGGEGLEEAAAEDVVLIHVFVGHDYRAAGQAVAQGVQSGTRFAFVSAGSGGLVGVRGCCIA
jgi:hypothetical protein